MELGYSAEKCLHTLKGVTRCALQRSVSAEYVLHRVVSLQGSAFAEGGCRVHRRVLALKIGERVSRATLLHISSHSSAFLCITLHVPRGIHFERE